MRTFAGLRLAITTLTVWPLRTTRIDRETAGIAMALAPLVGVLLGGASAGVALALHHAGANDLLSSVLVLVLLVVCTRGLHLDGLADTADALGAYQGRERALAIMKSPEIGPFGVVAIALVLMVDAAALTSLVSHGQWWAIVVAVVAGRVAISLGCRSGVPAARTEGLGALVAGTVRPAVAIAWVGALAGAAYTTGLSRPWLGPLAVVFSMGVTVALVEHARRRFGGVTGDVLGACCEIATATSLVVLSVA